MITVETISANRYAPRGSEAVNLYSNGTEDGSHLTIGQLVIAVAMRSAAAYESQSVIKMNAMTAGSGLLDQAAVYIDKLKAKVDELTQNQQQDMIDMQTLVNRRDTAYSASSNMVRSLGKAMNDTAGNF